MKSSSRIFSFNLIKIIFIFLVILHHTFYFAGYLNNAYMCVEGFFMMSGFLIYYHDKNKNVSLIEYSKNKIKSFYPYYLLVLILFTIFVAIFQPDKMFNNIFEALPEYLLLQGIISLRDTLNYPTWFLSVLFIASIIIYAMVKKLPKKILVIISISIIILTYGYLAYLGGVEQWTALFNVISLPFLRGFAALLLGVLIAVIREKIIDKSGKWNIYLEVFVFLTFVALLFIKGTLIEFLLILLQFVLILLISLPNSLFSKIGNNNIVTFLHQYQLLFYIVHALVIESIELIFSNLEINSFIKIVLILVSIFIFSVLIKKIMGLCIKVLQTINKRS